MRLEQSPALRPFPGEFVIFALIASRTGQYQVVDVIGRNGCARNATQRERMVNMVDIFSLSLLEFGMSTGCIVASIALAFQLLLDLCRSIRSLNCTLKSTSMDRVSMIPFFYLGAVIVGFVPDLLSLLSVQSVDTLACLYVWTVIVGFAACFIFLSSVSYSIACSCMLLNIGALPIAPGIVFLMLTNIGTTPIDFSVFLFMLTNIGTTPTYFALEPHPLFYFRMATPGLLTRSPLRMVIVSLYPLFYFRLLVISLSFGLYLRTAKISFLLFLSACLAVSIETIFCLIIAMKELRRCRVPLLAFRAFSTSFQWGIIWGYTSIHGRNFLSFVTPGECSRTRSGTPLLPPHYSITPPPKQLRGVMA